ncbi:hypothetical protein Tco_1091718 [Tanacetum coccineum]|uniref:Uncharacterized protein n=1 Tax=Tanacetum coccineum TaxID=301880 RepID=A0ABQ5I7U1_9ASTR
MEITATIDGRVKTVTEASIRRHLKLEDSDGISTLPNTKIFEKLALMGASKGYTRVDIPLFPTMLVQGPNLQGQGLTVQSDSHHTTTSGPSTSPPYMQTTHVVVQRATSAHDSPLPRVYSLGSDEGSMTLHELTVLCTTLSKKVESLEFDLKQTKLTYGAPFTKLMMLKKDTSNRGGSMIEDIDQDAGVSLVQIDAEDQGRFEDETDTQVSAHGEAHSQGSQPEDQLGVFSAAKILADVARVHTYSRRRRTVSTGSGGISTAEESVSTVGASMPVSTAGMDQGSIPSPSASKDKGKAIMTESEPEQATTKLKQRQEIAGYEAAIRLQEQLDEEESQRISRDAEVAQRLQEEIDASERQRMAQVHQAAQGFTDAESVMLYWLELPHDEDLVQQLQQVEKVLVKRFTMKLVGKLSIKLFKPDIEDFMGSFQVHVLDPFKWTVLCSCGVHHVSIDKGHDIFMLVEKDYPLTRGLMTVMLANKLQVDQSSEMANELLRKIFIQVERPRQ